MTISYPDSPRGEHVDVYQDARGAEIRVPDPYRWLEDPDSPATRRWVEAQNGVSEAFLDAIPARREYHERLTALWDYARPGVPWKRGARYFRTFNPGLLNQPVLQVADSATGPWQDLLDPNTLSTDGTVALMGMAVSWDGQTLAYGTQSAGSDWLTWRVRDVERQTDQPDLLEWSKFSGATWFPDGSGFYYGAYDAPQGDALTGTNRNQRLMFHRLGTPQTEDRVILARPDQPDWGFHAEVTEDARYLVVSVWIGTSPKNLLWVRPLESAAPFQELVSDFRAGFGVIGNQGDTFLIQTDEHAPRGKVIAWNIATGEQREVIPEGPDKLAFAALVRGQLLVATLKDASHRLHLYSVQGQFQREIPLPTLGTITALNARQDDPEVFIGFMSYLFPNTPYRLHLPDGELEPLTEPSVDFRVGDFQVAQEFAQSRDGTRVPLFIVSAKNLVRNGQNPTLLYGYGGFNISLTPSFSPGVLTWLERGGVFVSANLRGGGEYGEAWHQAGTLERKQNVFDDFIAVAEHLTKTGVTSPAHLGIQGGSNGGLLVGACMTQRPELFAAAVPQVGVLDMLRYHNFTIGWAWASDYGRSDDPAMLDTLLAYSPLHNLREGRHYPATLITTGDHDDRVVPAHSYKFAAELQRVQAGPKPALIRIQTRAGHGAGKPTSLLIAEAADVWAFLDQVLKAASSPASPLA